MTLWSREAALRSFGSVTPQSPSGAINITKPGAFNQSCILDIPDLGFYLIPFWDAPEIVDFWVLVGVIITALRFMLSNLGLTIIRRWMFCAGTLSILRGITCILTVFPVPALTCTYDSTSIFGTAFLILTRQISTCSDIIFSVHTTNLTLGGLVWYSYFDTVPILEKSVSYEPRHAALTKFMISLYVLIGLCLIVSNRAHFSSSVFQNVFLTTLIWVAYHNLIELITIRRACAIGGNHNILTRCFMWLEVGSQDLESTFYETSVLVIEDTTPQTHELFQDDSSEDDPEYDQAFSSQPILRSKYAVNQTGYQSFGFQND